MQNIVAAFRRMPRDMQLYTLAWGLLGFGYFGVFGVLFNLYLLRLGYGPQTIGLLVGSGQLVWGIAAIPAGLIGGRIGNRSAIIWGMIILVLLVTLLLLVEIVPVSLRIGWIATWWISSWVGSALMIVNATPYIMEVCAPEDRRATFTIQQAVLGLGGFVGSLAAGVLPGFLASFTGAVDASTASTAYWYVLWLCPLSYLAATLLMARTLARPPLIRTVQAGHDAKMPLFLILFIGLIVFLQTSGEGSIRAFFNVYLDTTLDVPITRIGIVMGLGQFLPILSSLAAPAVMTRVGNGRTIIFTGAASAIFMLILAFFANWLAASVGYIGVLLTISVASVARNVFSQEIVAPQWRTVMSSAFTVGLALGWSSAAGLGGFLITSFGYRALFLVGALLAALSGLLLWAYLRMGTKPSVLPSTP